METSDYIAVAALLVSLAGAPFTVGGWSSIVRRRGLVRKVTAAADRYRNASGGAAEVRAERTKAIEDLKEARSESKAPPSPRLNEAIEGLSGKMNAGAVNEEVRQALKSVRRRARLPF